MGKTIKDIAKMAGVSAVTVSRAINNKPGMSKETRERILKISRRLDYQPNLRARNLAKKRSDGFEIIIPWRSEFALANPYYTEVLKGIEKKARESEQYMIVSFDGEKNYQRLWQQGLSAGIIVLANLIDDPYIKEAHKAKVPMVLIPGDSNLGKVPSVDSDSIAGALKAVDHLVHMGHRKIAFLSGPKNTKYGIDRLEGYRRALTKNHIRFDRKLVFNFDLSEEGAYNGMRRMLSKSKIPTAALVTNDYSSLGVLRALREMNFRVPEDISVVSFGGTPLASMTSPPMTTVRAPFLDIGYEAAAMLLKIISGKRLRKRHLILPTELIVRESTGPPLDQAIRRMPNE